VEWSAFSFAAVAVILGVTIVMETRRIAAGFGRAIVATWQPVRAAYNKMQLTSGGLVRAPRASLMRRLQLIWVFDGRLNG
jgi:hypothetical protein